MVGYRSVLHVLRKLIDNGKDLFIICLILKEGGEGGGVWLITQFESLREHCNFHGLGGKL